MLVWTVLFISTSKSIGYLETNTSKPSYEFIDSLQNVDKKNAYLVNFSKRIETGKIVVSFSDRRLYYVFSRGHAISYPISAPRKDSRWHGILRISRKRVNPPWTPTSEMRAENPRLPDFVSGGHPRNPLGNRALYLGSSLYRIHGTDSPSSIGRSISKGCIRMHNRHIADLYNRVHVGSQVIVTWKSYK
ncbi:MAG: L,D-transpeptidase [Hyphomicrobiaceae bacterium]|nr:L,D-transpeptidase [Hyphomicrobiaceae bacterium]